MAGLAEAMQAKAVPVQTSCEGKHVASSVAKHKSVEWLAQRLTGNAVLLTHDDGLADSTRTVHKVHRRMQMHSQPRSVFHVVWVSQLCAPQHNQHGIIVSHTHHAEHNDALSTDAHLFAGLNAYSISYRSQSSNKTRHNTLIKCTWLHCRHHRAIKFPSLLMQCWTLLGPVEMASAQSTYQPGLVSWQQRLVRMWLSMGTGLFPARVGLLTYLK